jgi:hypothetical protein
MAEPLFNDANHVCIVTNDLDRAVRTWSDRYGVGPWNIWTFDGSNMSAVINGEPTEFGMRAALCQLSPTFRLEIIQPLDDRSPYADSLRARGGADHVHHLRLEVEDYEKTHRGLTDLGLDAFFEGDFSAGPDVPEPFHASYFTTEEDLGFIVEIGRVPAGHTMRAPDAVYPPA